MALAEKPNWQKELAELVPDEAERDLLVFWIQGAVANGHDLDQIKTDVFALNNILGTGEHNPESEVLAHIAYMAYVANKVEWDKKFEEI